jgi:hypothetical protein
VIIVANRTRGLWIQQALPEENWKPVPIPGLNTLYEVSDMGKVRTLVKRHNTPAGYFLSTKPHKTSGYCEAVMTSLGGIREHYYVHRLVMLAFDPNPNSDNLEVNHEDGNTARNVLSNLTWASHAQNIKHYIRVLKPARDIDKMDMRSNVEKLTKAEVEFIHRLMAEQFPIAKIAAMFCVSNDDVLSIPMAENIA